MILPQHPPTLQGRNPDDQPHGSGPSQERDPDEYSSVTTTSEEEESRFVALIAKLDYVYMFVNNCIFRLGALPSYHGIQNNHVLLRRSLPN